MNRRHRPHCSVVIATHNRRETLARTLLGLSNCGLARADYEIILVDNASTDGTPAAVASQVDELVRLQKNRGSCAKAFGVDRARGAWVVFLDDDSFPRPGSLQRMIEHFDADARLASAGFTVDLPDGRREGGALPGVFVGCGVGFRTDALRAVGGLDRTFFMQAEEYDLCFRLVSAGWRVDVFDDLHVEHRKIADARRTERTTYYDTRNNLRVAARYLPEPFRSIYRDDWTQRYRWLAGRAGHPAAFHRGFRSAALWAGLDRIRFRHRRLGPNGVEFFFRLREIEERMARLKRGGVRRVLLVDVGKNIYAFHHGARRAGLAIAAVADDRFSRPGRHYRGVPVLPVDEALRADFDAAIVSNTGAVHAESARTRVAARYDGLIHAWFAAAPSADAGIDPEMRTVPTAREPMAIG